MRDCRTLAAIVLLGLSGCELPASADGDRDAEQRRTEMLQRYSQSAAIRETVGAYTWVEGLRQLRVRGYGLVVGLGENGSQRCPARVRKRLAAEIRKHYGLGDSRQGLGSISPETMIDSRDTAVVLVQGEIGAARLRGARFDLSVTALPGTDTASLSGGRLYTCDLRYFRQAGEGSVQEGKVHAKGSGPVFINPFSHREERATPVNLRTGRVIGGGLSTEDRLVRLVLSSPSYARATQVQNAINDRFGRGERIAVAETPSHVTLNIPTRFAGRELDFLAVVRHLYISTDAARTEARVAALCAELLDVKAPHDNIGLALEGLGRITRPAMRNHYEHALPHVRFYAARSGLRLSDPLAVPVLRDAALDPDNPYHLDAIRELGKATDLFRAATVLEEVLQRDLGTTARTLAYRGLVQHRDPALQSRALDALVLDHFAEAGGEPLIHATVSDEPRILLLGSVTCSVPLFYRHPTGLVALRADARSSQIEIVRTLPSGRVSPPVRALADAASLITKLGAEAGQDRHGQITGLGLNYSQIVDVLSQLCESGALPARFTLERPEAHEVEPTGRSGRPDSEL